MSLGQILGWYTVLFEQRIIGRFRIIKYLKVNEGQEEE